MDMYGVETYHILGTEITKYTVIYGVYVRFWPTLHVLYVTCTHLPTGGSEVKHVLALRNKDTQQMTRTVCDICDMHSPSYRLQRSQTRVGTQKKSAARAAASISTALCAMRPPAHRRWKKESWWSSSVCSSGGTGFESAVWQSRVANNTLCVVGFFLYGCT